MAMLKGRDRKWRSPSTVCCGSEEDRSSKRRNVPCACKRNQFEGGEKTGESRKNEEITTNDEEINLKSLTERGDVRSPVYFRRFSCGQTSKVRL